MEKSIPLFIALHCGAQVPAEFLWFFICNLLFVLRLRPQRVFRLTTVCIYCARAPRSRSLLFIRISSIQVIVVVYANASIIPFRVWHNAHERCFHCVCGACELCAFRSAVGRRFKFANRMQCPEKCRLMGNHIDRWRQSIANGYGGCASVLCRWMNKWINVRTSCAYTENVYNVCSIYFPASKTDRQGKK